MLKWISELPWAVVIILCLTLGLAPFNPPHIMEKLQMLLSGQLRRAIDWFDLLMHGAPWLVLIVKGYLQVKKPELS